MCLDKYQDSISILDHPPVDRHSRGKSSRPAVESVPRQWVTPGESPAGAAPYHETDARLVHTTRSFPPSRGRWCTCSTTCGLATPKPTYGTPTNYCSPSHEELCSSWSPSMCTSCRSRPARGCYSPPEWPQKVVRSRRTNLWKRPFPCSGGTRTRLCRTAAVLSFEWRAYHISPPWPPHSPCFPSGPDNNLRLLKRERGGVILVDCHKIPMY